MARPRGEINVVCQNPRCRYYLKEIGKDVIINGKCCTVIRGITVKRCKTDFMKTKGTQIYRKRLSENEIINICKHLIEKNAIRSIERITGHHRGTIGRLLEEYDRARRTSE